MWYLQTPEQRRRKRDTSRDRRSVPALSGVPPPPVTDDPRPSPEGSTDRPRAHRDDKPSVDPRRASAAPSPGTPVPRFEALHQPFVQELAPPGQPHRGRRLDRRSSVHITRQQREHGLLEMLGVFRVASRRSIVTAIFDGHPFAANPTLGSLVRRGLIVQKKVPRGKSGYQVYMLTGKGRDLVAAGLRVRAKISS